VSGRVLVQFVVDTSGRVERNSIVVQLSAHPMFSESVRQVLARARFRPGRSRGALVRVLVEMPVVFEVRRMGE
jgi:TonB family protein